MTHELAGLFPPVTTPFDDEGRLLIEKFRENLDRYATYALSGLVVAGSNGENPCLSDDERLQLVREARPRIGKGRTMIVGAGRESTRLCLEFIRKVADLGADYVLVGTPCYFKPQMTDDALFAHYWSIADESPVPVIVYNIPQFTGVNTSPNLIARLAAHENIAGMKDSSGNLPMQAEIRRRTPERFRLLVGSAPTFLPSLIQGAAGGILAVTCVLPQMCIDLYEAFRAGDWKRAAEIQQRLTPPAAAVTTTFGVAGLKAALDLMGFYGGKPRLPLLPLDEARREALAGIFRKAGVL
jgi:4-hydroxy-2-oxoglutarate aldolase